MNDINLIDVQNELNKRKMEKNKIKHCLHCNKNITDSNWSRHLHSKKHLEKEEEMNRDGEV